MTVAVPIALGVLALGAVVMLLIAYSDRWYVWYRALTAPIRRWLEGRAVRRYWNRRREELPRMGRRP